ncbi:MAG: tetratricopeptide repeat protein [Acidobacteria bacterium]|nr:tetratricopeptide repeat protein [Acidobacteriota bacterium]
MADKLTFRQTLLQMLAAYCNLSFKEIGARCGMTERNVSHHLRRKRKRDEMKDDVFERLLSAFPCSPAAVSAVAACLESLADLDSGASGDLTAEELAEIAEAERGAARLTRKGLTEAAHRTRATPAEEGYPEPHEVAPARRRAEKLFRRLAELSPPIRLAVVRVVDRYHTWALCERICEASVREASRDLESAAAWARTAREIAQGVRGPHWWQRRVQGFAGGFGANVVRVKGELKPAAADFEAAKRLWLSGTDPLGLLDPGRMLDLEASLLRDQRHFREALTCLDEAVAVGRSPERALIKKGFTLEVMGEYERAIETLVQAEPLVERVGDPRLSYMLPFNLAVSYTHVGRFDEAAELAQRVGDLAAAQADEIELLRVLWLRGRIQAGLGRREEAHILLEQARQEFDRQGMAADAALALLEEAVLLLDEDRMGEVKALAGNLTKVLVSKGVHREALAALRLFQEAAEREEATAELARRVLRYLFRARHDQGLRFES